MEALNLKRLRIREFSHELCTGREVIEVELRGPGDHLSIKFRSSENIGQDSIPFLPPGRSL